jgi:hypothetical protein
LYGNIVYFFLRCAANEKNKSTIVCSSAHDFGFKADLNKYYTVEGSKEGQQNNEFRKIKEMVR